MTKLSCLIRTLNEEALLGTCITTIRKQAQALGINVEFVVVDSGSTDNTINIAKELNCKLLHIQGSVLKKFNYSDSLNTGLKVCNGEFVIIISAHAIPSDDSWLSVMLAGMESPDTAGCYCRQIPWPKSNWQERLRLEKQFPVNSQKAPNPFSNAASIIRKSNWEKQPFVLPSGEDWHWAQLMEGMGFKINYIPEISVFHSHYESPRAQAQRIINLNNSYNELLQKHESFFFKLFGTIRMLGRDTFAIIKIKEGIICKLKYFSEAARKSFWYLYESW